AAGGGGDGEGVDADEGDRRRGPRGEEGGAEEEGADAEESAGLAGGAVHAYCRAPLVRRRKASSSLTWRGVKEATRAPLARRASRTAWWERDWPGAGGASSTMIWSGRSGSRETLATPSARARASWARMRPASSPFSRVTAMRSPAWVRA